jgi:hypothetical protein
LYFIGGYRKVNILFLIGNGFDLNLKLETSFRDILEEFRNDTSKDDLTISKFKNNIKNNINTWVDFEKELGKYTINFYDENKILDLSVILFKDKISCLVTQVEKFRETLRKKLKYEESRINYIDNKEIIKNSFIEALIDFVYRLDDEPKNKLKELIIPINNKMEYTYNFITFNYTNILDECIELLKQEYGILLEHIVNQTTETHILGEILHVHGTLDKYMILGVDNKEQIDNVDIRDDPVIQRLLIKPFTNKKIKENREEKGLELINKSEIIVTFGMSIGITDKTWWKHINDWLKRKSSRQLILFYHDDSEDSSDPNKQILKEQMVLEKYFSALGLVEEDEKIKVKDQIHIPATSGKMFKMDIIMK